MPKIPGDMNLLLGYGVDPKQRRIYLHNALSHPASSGKGAGENPTEFIMRSLLHLGQDPRRPLELWINSPGGDIWEAWGLYDVLKFGVQSPIITVGWGSVCSAAGMLLATGTHRFATEGCMFMGHEATSETGGINRRASRARARAEDVLADRWNKVMAAHTNRSEGWWKKTFETKPEFWFGSSQMKAHGIIDEIYSIAAVKALGYPSY